MALMWSPIRHPDFLALESFNAKAIKMKYVLGRSAHLNGMLVLEAALAAVRCCRWRCLRPAGGGGGGTDRLQCVHVLITAAPPQLMQRRRMCAST